jgi:cellulose synthase operon protein YhjU
MMIWNLYFIIKIGLHLGGFLALSPLLNLGLFFLLLLTNPALYEAKRVLSALRYLTFTIPAIALLLHELGLVVSLALVDQIVALFGFSVDYLWELVKRTVQPWMLWSGVLAFFLVQALNRYVRISSWVALGLFLVLAKQTLPFLQPAVEPETLAENTEGGLLAQTRVNLSPAELIALGQVDFQKLRVARDQESQTKLRDIANDGAGPAATLNLFFERQRNLAVNAFSPPENPDFDVVVLQICSMSWADLRFAKLSQHPLIRQADFIFENFNSATSYSGPAAIRLLRGKCGQTSHNALYQNTSESCLLYEQLRRTGFEVEIGMNHDGRFQDFRQLVQNNIGSKPVERVAYNDVPVGVQAFDGSVIGRDGDYLRAWWKKRLESESPAVAYYYNSITLHDGNRLLNSNLNSINTYAIRTERVLNDIQSVLGEIRRSGRQAMVLVVPEHGAGLSGEYGQLVGLRELPTPAITKVPVLGYWIAPNYQQDPNGPVFIKQPTSYLALSELLNRWLKQNETQKLAPSWPVILSNLPDTRLVSQQGNITVMESQGSYWIKAPGTAWRILGATQASTAGTAQ